MEACLQVVSENWNALENDDWFLRKIEADHLGALLCKLHGGHVTEEAKLHMMLAWLEAPLNSYIRSLRAREFEGLLSKLDLDQISSDFLGSLSNEIWGLPLSDSCRKRLLEFSNRNLPSSCIHDTQPSYEVSVNRCFHHNRKQL